ncbi:Cut9 interacting protein Scn1 [Purpureocillium lavendulum]|uniref:Cut9 interacting protein Scn1 n=2 Tax=Purpureocillium lavendulum TaxID=1247861 RepID=A0AB34FZV9_9HYPO|nr:Ribonuclease H-like protein [Purpureocillium lavendulum]KAJ6444318.1 Cut9 interacting protein Scn1 [Purpureocillium lavendulum]
MPATDLEVSSRVVLKGPGNWDVWISIVRKFAKTQDVWEHIDPGLANKAELTPPAEPTASEAKAGAASMNELIGDDLRKYEILQARYRSQLQVYKDKKKALVTLQEHIVKTVGSYYNIIAKEDDVAKELMILKNRIKPTDWARETEITDQYYATLKAVNRTKIEEWISQWQVILNEAKNLDLPDVKGLRPTRHFLKAVGLIDPTFSKYWINRMEGEAMISSNDDWQKSFPDGIKISEIFERSYRTTSSSPNPKGAFATYQGEGEPHASKANSKNPGGRPICLCGRRHLYSECYYLSESARPAGWSPDSKVQEDINQKLQDPTMKGRVERAIEKKRKTGGQPQQQPASELKGTAFAGAIAATLSGHSTPTRHQDGTCNHSTFTTTAVYPLKNSFILDSGSDFHICNNSERFVEGTYKPCDELEGAFAGDTHLEILGHGDVLIRIGTKDTFKLQNVAYVPRFHTNVASLDRFVQRGYNWNPATGAVFKDGKTIFRTERRYRQPVIEFNQVNYESHAAQATAFTSSAQPRPKSAADAMLWHKRLGHLGAEALEHLVQETTGAKIKGPLKIECKDCAVSKAKRIVSRRSPQTKAPRPFWRIYVDIFAMSNGYNGMKHATLIRDEYTSMIYIYLLRDATVESVLGVHKAFEAYVQRQFHTSICIIHRDNDRALQSEYLDWIKSRGIEDEPTAPDTPAQNGPAERSGGVVGSQSRTMQVGANLPDELWPETWKTAVYLHNRSPQQAHNWKTPFERLHQWLRENNRDTGYLQTQPDITHLKAYGCRAYPLTREALKEKQKKHLKTHPHAEVGYLVGYDSTNIFRIWIPERQEVRRVRDVTFDETCHYDPKDHQPQSLPSVEPLQVQLPAHIESDSELDENEVLGLHAHGESSAEDDDRSTRSASIESTVWVGGRPISEELREYEAQVASQTGYLTPDESQRGSQHLHEDNDQSEKSEDHTIHDKDASNIQHGHDHGRSDTRENDQPRRKSARQRKQTERAREAAAGSFAVYRSSFFTGREQRLHRKSLPPEPRNYHELTKHRFEQDFRNAMEIEWTSVNKRGTVQPIPKDQATGQVLPLTWVFKYKFDKHGYLQKFKARICVRGDLQQPGSKDTYAATLAGRSFRILMAITAKFDLETRQLDAINAFTNSVLDEDVYVQFPDGYRRRGWVLKLLRALYGLRRSPLLWQKDLTAAFEKLGLRQSQEEPCLFTNNWLTVFFFVDDIVLLHRAKHQRAADEFIVKLKAQYEMKDLGELKWFLGIRILRDRTARKLWLCQDSYIDNIANQYGIAKRDHFKGNLFPSNKLQPREDQSTPNQVHRYQQKVGSVNYVAVITRPDIAKPISKLAEHLLNPSERHDHLADRLMEYLWSTRYLAIQFNGNRSTDMVKVNHSSIPREIRVASDAAFADDSETRKSSQGYVITLFGGPVSWKASKQATVTTSSTEAELLAFTSTAKEAIAMQRLFQQINLKLDHPLQIECDNQQTIRLVTADLPRLKTQLKHVDVHNCWARQAYQQNQFQVSYTPTTEMVADGLTKVLPDQKFKRFVEQLALVDIQSVLETQNESDSD